MAKPLSARVKIALPMPCLQRQIDKWLVSCWKVLVRPVAITSKIPATKRIEQ
jgi:hypothetical protein